MSESNPLTPKKRGRLRKIKVADNLQQLATDELSKL